MHRGSQKERSPSVGPLLLDPKTSCRQLLCLQDLPFNPLQLVLRPAPGITESEGGKGPQEGTSPTPQARLPPPLSLAAALLQGVPPKLVPFDPS